MFSSDLDVSLCEHCFLLKQSLHVQYYFLQALDPEDWSGDSCSYRILYRQIAPNSTWNNATRVFGGCSRNSYNVFSLIPNTETEIAIRAENIVGAGPSSPIVRTRSGQSTPQRIASVTIVHVDASSIELEWSAIPVSPPKTVDGYWVRIVYDAG